MDILKWRTSYETGISSMDTQHQKLIALINNIYKVLRKEKPNESVEGVLNELILYAEKHFQEEEDLLEFNGYPDLSNHIAMHQSYLDELENLMIGWKMEDEVVAKNIYAFLRHWWMEHIVAEDRKYGEFLRAKGVE